MKANGLDLVRDFVANEREREGEIQEKTSVKTKWPAFLFVEEAVRGRQTGRQIQVNGQSMLMTKPPGPLGLFQVLYRTLVVPSTI
ncbi:hypothetical protein WN48_00191 [Eufriesea mexicana]|nr:hypothetical protein WN48_00191 [Eufriesea mexicana]